LRGGETTCAPNLEKTKVHWISDEIPSSKRICLRMGLGSVFRFNGLFGGGEKPKELQLAKERTGVAKIPSHLQVNGGVDRPTTEDEKSGDHGRGCFAPIAKTSEVRRASNKSQYG